MTTSNNHFRHFRHRIMYAKCADIKKLYTDTHMDTFTNIRISGSVWFMSYDCKRDR